MKKIMLVAAIALCAMSCNKGQATDAQTTTDSTVVAEEVQEVVEAAAEVVEEAAEVVEAAQ